jgi:valyl-tRNA synthetase
MDWKREKYTFDADRSRAVNTMFKMMYEDGLIERGFRVINWDPQFQTTLSDEEVESKNVKARLVTFKYDKDFPITISTTRPETKFGDTAVAVHPDDARYKEFIGKTFTPVFCGKSLTIRIIADEAVDPAFGTGALGVTPAHSLIDADMAGRHGLPTVQVIDKNTRMIDVPEPFLEKTTIETRVLVEERLKQDGLLVSVEEIEQVLPVAQRGGAPVEQLPMKQWFVRVNKSFTLRQDTLGKWKRGEKATLKELMHYAVDSHQTRIIPNNFEKIYFHWIDNLRDWCISRQIWFGHQIPVWYQGEEMKFSEVSPGEGWVRDSDTLDTWFSSGTWTFSTLGWPDAASVDKNGKLVKTGELATYHPTNVLETGRDLIFFWVARMILMTVYALGEVPFRDVCLDGLVLDEQGRKMSKSLGNTLDPLDLIPKFGTDAVRLSLVMGTSPGMDQKLSEEKIKDFRNFTNKLWNISRFILMQMGGVQTPLLDKGGAGGGFSLADEWILSRLAEVTASVTRKIQEYQLSSAGEELRDFTWSDLADWYLEIAKVEGGKKEILSTILRTMLKLWHPFMPFVTEEIWRLAGFEGMLMVEEWPSKSSFEVKKLEASMYFSRLRLLVTDMRRLRAEQKIEAAKQVSFACVLDEGTRASLEENRAWMLRLTNASSIESVPSIPSGWAVTSSGPSAIGLDIAGAVDVEKEREKMTKELEEIATYIASLEQKLSNKEFLAKAPEKVTGEMRAKLEEAQKKRVALEERLRSIG